jgi:hypothetical protein
LVAVVVAVAVTSWVMVTVPLPGVVTVAVAVAVWVTVCVAVLVAVDVWVAVLVSVAVLVTVICPYDLPGKDRCEPGWESAASFEAHPAPRATSANKRSDRLLFIEPPMNELMPTMPGWSSARDGR